PWCRAVIRPWTFRPPFLGSGRTSDFSGSERVISAKSAAVAPRPPGVVGLYLRLAMSYIPSAHRAAEGLDPDPVGELDLRPLRPPALSPAGTGALALALPVAGVHRRHPHVEDLLDRDLDRSLVGVRVDEERVPVLVQQAVALLRDDGLDDDVAWVGDGSHYSPSLFAGFPAARNCSSASLVNTTSSLASTSYVFSWPGSSRCTRGSLRSESQLRRSSRPSTTRTRLRSVTWLSVFNAAF